MNLRPKQFSLSMLPPNTALYKPPSLIACCMILLSHLPLTPPLPCSSLSPSSPPPLRLPPYSFSSLSPHFFLHFFPLLLSLPLLVLHRPEVLHGIDWFRDPCLRPHALRSGSPQEGEYVLSRTYRPLPVLYFAVI